MTSREERYVRDEAGEVVAEAEAMLSGRMMDQYGWDGAAPGWVWLNMLAHADWPTLADMADGAVRCRRTVWDSAVMFLAAELRWAAGTADGLVALQRSELIPLQLALLDGGSRTPSTPAELVSLVRSCLTRVRARQAHPGVAWSPRSDAG